MFGPFKKEKPFQGLTGFGGGATGLAQHTAAGGGAIDATGGTKVDVDGYSTHYFTSSGTFTINSGSGDVEYLIVAGGGSGGQGASGGSGIVANGGGGAGGVVASFAEGPGGPPGSPGGGAALPAQDLSPGSYTVTVGAGAVGGPTNPN